MASNSLLPIKFQNLIELLADRLLKIISDDRSLRNFGIYIRRNSNNRVLLVKKKKTFHTHLHVYVAVSHMLMCIKIRNMI